MSNPPSPPPFLPWDQCLNALDDSALKSYAAWRGFSLDFCLYLRSIRAIGLYVDPRSGTAYFCYPIVSIGGTVIAEQVFTGTTPKAFMTAGARGHLSPVILGPLPHAKHIFPSESPHDIYAFADRTELWKDPDICFIGTRGATNHALLQNLPWPELSVAPEICLLCQNDQPNPRGGPTANQRWVEHFASVSPFPYWTWNPPAGLKDFNDWTKTGVTQDDLVNQLIALKKTRKPFPPGPQFEIIEAADLPTDMPPEIIQGVLHQCGKMLIAGDSKSYKSWALIDLAVCVLNGFDWWGFKTLKGPVLFLNLELIKPEFQRRLTLVAKARNASIRGLRVLNLRGKKITPGFLFELAEQIAKAGYILVVLDPIYKLLAGRDESKAGDITELMNRCEEFATIANCALAVCHHFAKGNMALREAIDRTSGSGVWARDPDAILPLTKHEEKNCYTVEPTVRDFPEIKPFVLKLSFPVFNPEASLNPADLKKRGPKATFSVSDLIDNITILEELSTVEFRRRVMAETGMSQALFYHLKKAALAQGVLFQSKITKLIKRTK